MSRQVNINISKEFTEQLISELETFNDANPDYPTIQALYVLLNSKLREINNSSTLPILQLIDNAKASGIQKPKIRIGDYEYSLAPPTGKNPGWVYVKISGSYLGKISPNLGELYLLQDHHIPTVKEHIHSPNDAIIKHGKKTGNCSFCGRELTNSLSIEAGVGPICAEKYGIAFDFENYYKEETSLESL